MTKQIKLSEAAETTLTYIIEDLGAGHWTCGGGRPAVSQKDRLIAIRTQAGIHYLRGGCTVLKVPRRGGAK
jgi:hypothetical protein